MLTAGLGLVSASLAGVGVENLDEAATNTAIGADWANNVDLNRTCKSGTAGKLACNDEGGGEPDWNLPFDGTFRGPRRAKKLGDSLIFPRS